MKVTIEIDNGKGAMQEIEAKNVEWAQGADGSVIGSIIMDHVEIAGGKDIFNEVLTQVPFNIYVQVGNSTESAQNVMVMSKHVDAEEGEFAYMFCESDSIDSEKDDLREV